MKLTELMQGKVPKPEYEGWVTMMILSLPST